MYISCYLFCLMMVLLYAAPNLAQAADRCDLQLYKHGDKLVIIGDKKTGFFYYLSGYKVRISSLHSHADLHANAIPISKSGRQGEYILPKGVRDVLMICSHKSMPKWDQRFHFKSVAKNPSHNGESLDIEQPSGAFRGGGNSAGTTDDTGNDGPDYEKADVSD